jgi:hypothetical protein
VTGLPEPREDHAVAMARFAQAILEDMITVASGLVTKLGPGTSNLILRIGVRVKCAWLIESIRNF